MADQKDYTKQLGPPAHVNTPQESEALDLSPEYQGDETSSKPPAPPQKRSAFPVSDCAHDGGFCGGG